MIVKKVQGKINEVKGDKFEKFVYNRLKQSELFDKVILGGEVGQSDILAYQNDEKLFIYSLKNLKIDRDPYWLIVNPKNEEGENELKPEIKFAKLSHFDYNIHLILLVYDNYNDRIIQKEIDYKDPQNINLAKGVSI
jgi:hypothetical protein